MGKLDNKLLQKKKKKKKKKEYCSPVKHLYNYLYFPQTDYTPTNEA